MDKFDLFVKQLDELIVDIPHKLCGDHVIGHAMALHSIRNAAYVAQQQAKQEVDKPK